MPHKRRPKPKPKPSQPPLKRLSDAQRSGEIARLLAATEAQIQSAFAEARASVQPILQQFAAAYAAEQARLAEEEDDPHAKVPAHWLVTSGWGAKVRKALTAAHQDASAQARRAVLRSLRTTWGQGAADARALLMVAMRPAMRAGLTTWRPK